MKRSFFAASPASVAAVGQKTDKKVPNHSCEKVRHQPFICGAWEKSCKTPFARTFRKLLLFFFNKIRYVPNRL